MKKILLICALLFATLVLPALKAQAQDPEQIKIVLELLTGEEVKNWHYAEPSPRVTAFLNSSADYQAFLEDIAELNAEDGRHIDLLWVKYKGELYLLANVDFFGAQFLLAIASFSPNGKLTDTPLFDIFM